MSRQRLADEAKISISTLEKALSGRRPFTLATTIRLEEALGVGLRRAIGSPPRPHAPSGLAPDDLGSYSRPAVTWIEGDYLTLRPSFGDRDAIYAYRTEISWDQGGSCLVFQECGADRRGIHAGRARVGAEPVRAHLSRHQQARAVPADHRLAADDQRRDARHPDDAAGRGAARSSRPIATPIVLVPLAAVPGAEFGRITPGHRWLRALPPVAPRAPSKSRSRCSCRADRPPPPPLCRHIFRNLAEARPFPPRRSYAAEV